MLVSLFRTFLLFVAVMIGMRIMGKRQIGDMSPNELVITILVSQIATIPLQDINQPVINGVLSVFLLVILEVCVSLITMKWKKARDVINGGPVVIIQDGVIDQQAMERLRMTVDDLQEDLRQQQIFHMEDIEFGIVENDGKFSVMLKSGARPATVDDMDVPHDDSGIAVPVICDGDYQDEFIRVMGLTKADVDKHLTSRKLELGEVFLMTIDRLGKTVVVKKEERP